MDNLALSSRNAYLSRVERSIAGCLYAALKKGEAVWRECGSRDDAVEAAAEIIEDVKAAGAHTGLIVKLDYIEINDPETFEVVSSPAGVASRKDVIISGAVWIGRTRLIDNLIIREDGRLKL